MISWQPTLREVLEGTLAAEACGRDFYRDMAGCFAHQPTVEAMWREMMLDECSHISELTRIRGRLGAEELEGIADPTHLRSAKEVCESMTCGWQDRVGTLEDAYQIALAFEASEINELFKFFASRYVSSDDRRRFLLTEIIEHQAKLAEFDERVGPEEWRRVVRAQWELGEGQSAEASSA